MANIEIEELERENPTPNVANPATQQNSADGCDLMPVALTTLLPFVVYLQTPLHWKNSVLTMC